MRRWIAGLAAAVLLPACGDGSKSQSASDVNGPPPPDTTGALGTGQPPFVRIISPGPRTKCHEGATVLLQAVAVDPNSLITRVNFFDRDRLIGGKSTVPFTVA